MILDNSKSALFMVMLYLLQHYSTVVSHLKHLQKNIKTFTFPPNKLNMKNIVSKLEIKALILLNLQNSYGVTYILLKALENLAENLKEVHPEVSFTSY